MMVAHLKVPKGYQLTEVGVIPKDWKIASTQDLVDTATPIRYGVVQVGQHVDSGVPIIAIKYLKNISRAPLHRAATNLEASYKGSRVESGDVLISIKGTIGRVGVTPPEFIGNISRDLARIRPNEKVLSDFLAFQLEASHTQKRISQATVGTTRLEFSIATLRSFQITLPPTLAEQEAIASALSDADSWIESLEELVAKKRHLKQAAMQQLLTGKKRLPGFDGKWEVKRLPDICWYQEGPGVRNTQFTTSGVKLLNGTNIYRGILDLDRTTRFISYKEANGPYSHFLADVDDLVIASSGITVDRFHEKVACVRELDLPFCMNTSTIRFKPNEKLLSKGYLFHYLCSNEFKDVIGGQATGSAQLNFGPSHLAKVVLSTPLVKEQTAIAEVLSDMDAEIKAIETKLTKARQIKQGMMQELLTGRIRLVKPGRVG